MKNKKKQMTQRRLLAVACAVPFLLRAAWAFTHGDPKTGFIALLFTTSNLIIFW